MLSIDPDTVGSSDDLNGEFKEKHFTDLCASPDFGVAYDRVEIVGHEVFEGAEVDPETGLLQVGDRPLTLDPPSPSPPPPPPSLCLPASTNPRLTVKTPLTPPSSLSLSQYEILIKIHALPAVVTRSIGEVAEALLAEFAAEDEKVGLPSTTTVCPKMSDPQLFALNYCLP